MVLGAVTKHFCLCKTPHSKSGATYQQSARIRRDLLKASFYRPGLDEDMYSNEMQQAVAAANQQRASTMKSVNLNFDMYFE